MNKNIDLTQILKDCPKGTKFYTPVWGEVTFNTINKGCLYPVCIYADEYSDYTNLTKDGRYLNIPNSECIIFPSKEQRDWSKFTAPWYKKEKFDPKTLKPFDRVLIKDVIWSVGLFSHYNKNACYYSCECVGGTITKYCIPYNDETKHLVGTSEEAPEYYRYWNNN